MSNFTALAVYEMLANGRGEIVTLRRLGNSPPDDVTVLAKIDDFTPQPLAGNMAQTMRSAIISDLEIQQSGWPGPPKRLDQIITGDGKTLSISAVSTTTLIGEGNIMHNLKTLGG